MPTLSACAGAGEESGGAETFTGIASEEPGPVHVHGLGVNPADRALFVATHTGLFRAPTGATKARRVGRSYQDTMGFTVAGPDYFLGSGHPDVAALQEGTPPLLGLIESKDGGRTWASVSLLGKADFHVLRFIGDRVYGYDANGNRLLTSRDEGKTWEKLTVPSPLLDLAANPANPDHLIAAGQVGLFASRDGGRRWGLLSVDAGLLAWPSERRLYMIDGDGFVYRSQDGGEGRTPVGEIGGQPAALAAEGNEQLLVALHDGTVKISTDGGETWAVRSTP
jgi:sortilin (neurotensin receptor 3)/BNR/Asp-box repeat protein